MACISDAIGEVLHCSEKSGNFLDVMAYIQAFLPEFHKNIYERIVGISKPGMLQIELVAQNEAERFHGD
jgi:hypothetical protein